MYAGSTRNDSARAHEHIAFSLVFFLLFVRGFTAAAMTDNGLIASYIVMVHSCGIIQL